MPDLQNFSVPSGNSEIVNVDIDADFIVDTLVGTTITFKVWDQEHGVRTPDLEPLISKNNSGDEIETPESPSFRIIVHLEPEDTEEMLGNYYFEILIVDETGDRVTTTQGIMTVTESDS